MYKRQIYNRLHIFCGYCDICILFSCPTTFLIAEKLRVSLLYQRHLSCFYWYVGNDQQFFDKIIRHPGCIKILPGLSLIHIYGDEVNELAVASFNYVKQDIACLLYTSKKERYTMCASGLIKWIPRAKKCMENIHP